MANSWSFIRNSLTSASTDNGVTFDVPDQRQWHLLWIWVEFATSDTAATRQVEMQIADTAADIMLTVPAAMTQAASASYKYLFAPGVDDLTAVRDSDWICVAIPPSTILNQGWSLSIIDNSSADLSSDVFTVHMAGFMRGSLRRLVPR